MKILIGKIAARCIACKGHEWRTIHDGRSLFSEVFCKLCGRRSICADLALQVPLEPGNAPLMWTSKDDEPWINGITRTALR
jgi:hypothetical protein